MGQGDKGHPLGSAPQGRKGVGSWSLRVDFSKWDREINRCSWSGKLRLAWYLTLGLSINPSELFIYLLTRKKQCDIKLSALKAKVKQDLNGVFTPRKSRRT